MLQDILSQSYHKCSTHTGFTGKATQTVYFQKTDYFPFNRRERKHVNKKTPTIFVGVLIDKSCTKVNDIDLQNLKLASLLH